jgi:hypothetical protein
MLEIVELRTVEFYETTDYIRGGEGYTTADIPTITVTSSGGSNASLIVKEILGIRIGI